MSLYDVKRRFQAASGGIWIDIITQEESQIKEALGRGDAVIVEVAAVTEALTVHALAVDDLDRFGSLPAWAAFQCSGREVAFDSTFYRLDVEPFQVAREYQIGRGAMFIPHLSIEHCPPKSGDDDDEGGEDGLAGGPVKARPGPGDEPPPPPAQVRAPRSR